MKLTKNTELENTFTNVEEVDNKQSTLIDYENIENTPFTIVKNENLYYGVIGNHRLTEAYNEKEELIKDLTKIDWNRITQVMWAIVEKINKLKENE